VPRRGRDVGYESSSSTCHEDSPRRPRPPSKRGAAGIPTIIDVEKGAAWHRRPAPNTSTPIHRGPVNFPQR